MCLVVGGKKAVPDAVTEKWATPACGVAGLACTSQKQLDENPRRIDENSEIIMNIRHTEV